ncbi:unnamed protein product, partial [Linum tenue]
CNPARRLAGKVALITGGASGIGASTAKLFARNGATVVIADVQTEEIIGPAAAAATFVYCDVSKESDVERAVDAAVAAHGRLDVLFSNAGVTGDVATGHQILTTSGQDLKKVFDVNVMGGFYCAKHAARVMVPRRRGVILFTASVVTETYGYFAHPYTASKHALVGLMRNLCVELGPHGVRVNAVSLLGVPTPMALAAAGGMDRKSFQDYNSDKACLKNAVLEVEDIAQAALYLASDESQFVSGLNLMVDGGYNLRSA